jgi:SAM-dependent methyltransferase
VKPSFDRLATVYELLEKLTFGKRLHTCRSAYLDQLGFCRSALILGDGDGRFVADLVRTHGTIRVDSLDISPSMIALARQRVARIPGAEQRVRFALSDATIDPIPATGYHLVVTNFFLDCFTASELSVLIPRIAICCAPNALWIDGDFRLPVAGWERFLGSLLLRAMYGFFRLTTRLRVDRLADPAPFIAGQGFDLQSEVQWLHGFLSARLWVRSSMRPFVLPPEPAGRTFNN